MGYRSLDFGHSTLNEIVREAVALVSRESRRRGIDMEVEPADRLPIVRGDRVHLGQVLINLISNGMEAMGLGLAITRTLVERHGGQNWAENAAGSGATFRFSLPVHAQPNDALTLGQREAVT